MTGKKRPEGATIRPARPEDAARLFELAEATIAETDFLMRGPGEGPRSPDDWRAAIERHGRHGDFDLVAEADGALVGMCGASRGAYARNRHTATVGVAVRQDHARRGIGSDLLRAVEDWALAEGVSRLELAVMRNNKAARRLYRKLGYRTEGRRRRAVRLGDAFVDEVIMAKMLKGI